MKNIFVIVFISLALGANAQVDRSKAPTPGPAPEIRLGEYESFELDNGLKVFVVENHKLPQVQFSLVLAHEGVNEGEKAGYVSLAGQLLKHGTTTRTKAQLDKEIDFIGASLGTSSSGIYASALTRHSDKLLELMTDVLYNANFPEAELDKLKKQTLSGLAAAKEDPNAIASNVSQALVYGKGHPYGEITTEESVEKITLDDIKSYYKTYYVPNNAYLAIVGDIEVKRAKELAKKYFSSWKKGNVEKKEFRAPSRPSEAIVALVDRPNSVQSVINISYPLELQPGAEDVEKARVMNQILGGGFSSRLMQNLREDKAFTYGARSSLNSDKLVGRFTASASVRNEVTDSAVNEFMYELKRLRDEPVEAKELAAAKASIMGSFGRSLESPSTIANFAINMERYDLPKDYYQTYLQRIEAVTAEDITAMANKYILPAEAYVIIVGKAEEIEGKLSDFGKVQKYDIYGNIEKKADASTLPSYQEVLNKYLAAIGGEAKVEAVKNISIKSSAQMQGMTINMVNINSQPGKAMNTVLLGTQEIQKMIFNSGEAKMTAQGQNIPLDEKMLKELSYNTYIFPELHYDEIGAQVDVQDIKTVNGEDAYQVQVKYPSGTTKTEFFSISTGLKLKTEGLPTGAITYGDYKEVDGVKIPHSMKIATPQGPLEAKITEVKINSDIPASTFEIK